MTIARILQTSLLVLSAAVSMGAQPAGTPPKTVAVLAILTVAPNVARERINAVLPEEVRATVRLYLGGKIREWFSRADGKGVVFIMDCKDVAEADALLKALPLGKLEYLQHELIPLAPLAPLGLLAAEPPAQH